MITMKIKLYKDTSGALHGEFLEGLDSITKYNSGTNVIEVEPSGFWLAEGEMLRISFATSLNEDDVETETVGFYLMETDMDGRWKTTPDPLVLSRRGAWWLDLQIVSAWNESKKDFANKYSLAEKLLFSVNAVIDANGKEVTYADVISLYHTATDSANSAWYYAESARESYNQAKEEADKAASSASGANEALLAAVEAATQAKDSETKAKESENNAAASAKHASDSALDSETSAGESATYASESESYSIEAQGHANNAENSAKYAETLSNYAKNASEFSERYANQSKNYSQDAEYSAGSAQNQATIAYGHATSAAAAASAAGTFAECAEAAASETETLYHYRGSVQTYADLPTTGMKVGDVYNVIGKYGDFGAGTNFAWNGEVWDSLGGNFDLSPFIKKTEVSELGKTGKLSDGITDSTHRLVTDGEKSQWNNKQNKLTFDATPTENSQNPVTSGGVAAKLEEYVTKDTDQSISGKKIFKSILLDDPNVSSDMYIEPHRISITGNFQGYDIYYGTDGVDIYYDNSNYQSHYGERYIYYADNVNNGSITLTPLIDSETGDYAPITDDYELYLPLKSGTLARVEDVAEVNEKLKREIDTLYKIGEQAGTYTVTEVEDTYISRGTAYGLNIVDGAQTPVQEIRGKTVATKNLIPYPYIDTTKTDHGVNWTDLGDGRLKVVGETANAFSTYFLSRKNIFVAGNTYTLKDCVVSYKENDVEYYLSSQTGSKTFVWLESWTLVMIYVQILRNTTVDKIIAPMINIGSEALDFEPYDSDTLFVETPIELSEYDIAYPEKGEVKRQSNTVVFDGTEVWEYAEIEGHNRFYTSLSASDNVESICNIYERVTSYSDLTNGKYIIYDNLLSIKDETYTTVEQWKSRLSALADSGNPLSVIYKTAEVTTEAVEFNKSSYTAWKNGSETIEQGEIDNSEYGAELTVSQKYYTLAGGTNNEN